MVRILAPAKVNLGLRILAREDSGYHQLETVFLGVQFGDSLSVACRGSEITVNTIGPPMGPMEENLVFRAAREFLELAGRKVGLEIGLEKRIPVQGGLGGGSSDAAATLRALTALFPGWVKDDQLRALAGRLGSDVPFFLSPSPMAIAWGRGDRLLSLPPLPEAPVILAVPPFGVSTQEAYRLLDRDREESSRSRAPAFHTLGALGSWKEMAVWAENDFEDVLFRAFPALEHLGSAMKEVGARISRLSGSGSALFGVFDGEGDARQAVPALEEAFPDTRFVLTRTLEEFPDPILEPGVES